MPKAIGIDLGPPTLVSVWGMARLVQGKGNKAGGIAILTPYAATVRHMFLLENAAI